MVERLFKKVKSVLLADPELLYKEERKLANQPFYFPGENGQAVLLIHGWTSVPYEVRRLGIYLNENGYTVSGPMLRGHGTVPKDLERVKWTEWLHDVTAAYDELKKNHEKVYVIGTSIGASLAVILAKNRQDVAGMVLLAMPYKIRLERTAILLAKLSSLFRKYNKKYYPPTFGVSTTITRVISYQTYPIKSALEVFELIKISRKELPKVKQPCLLMESTSDHITARKNLDIIHKKIGSKVKEKKYIPRAYHTFISDIKNEGVFEDILNFIEEN
ncbi:MAG: alpha/beta fold hydrolase [Candidatus Pacebacteria bacterium]|nr:alpha/beta fold hydrolase [Candidatus Paceibacterota bacterium]MDR3582988.1 alpha/beta fold hydrolase [Candidatus Paceibacterota bacterium]